MSLEIEVKGTEELMRVLEGLPLKMREKVDARLGEGAEIVAERAREIVPVRTGYLRSTIMTARRGSLQWRVLAYAFYAKFVEYGTSRMAAKPYLRPALILCRSMIVFLAKRGIAETVEERMK